MIIGQKKARNIEEGDKVAFGHREYEIEFAELECIEGQKVVHIICECTTDPEDSGEMWFHPDRKLKISEAGDDAKPIKPTQQTNSLLFP